MSKTNPSQQDVGTVEGTKNGTSVPCMTQVSVIDGNVVAYTYTLAEQLGVAPFLSSKAARELAQLLQDAADQAESGEES